MQQRSLQRSQLQGELAVTVASPSGDAPAQHGERFWDTSNEALLGGVVDATRSAQADEPKAVVHKPPADSVPDVSALGNGSAIRSTVDLAETMKKSSTTETGRDAEGSVTSDTAASGILSSGITPSIIRYKGVYWVRQRGNEQPHCAYRATQGNLGAVSELPRDGGSCAITTHTATLLFDPPQPYPDGVFTPQRVDIRRLEFNKDQAGLPAVHAISLGHVTFLLSSSATPVLCMS